jgi:hypothetical protein
LVTDCSRIGAWGSRRVRFSHIEIQTKAKKWKPMKAKSLSFVFICFAELWLFNALRRIQIEKTFLCASRRRHVQNAYRPNVLKLGHRWRSITGSIETIAHSSTFCKLMPRILKRGPTRTKERAMAGLVPAIHGVRRNERREGEHGQRASFWKSLLLIAATSAGSLKRRSVDGRDKPGQDGQARRGNANQQLTL